MTANLEPIRKRTYSKERDAAFQGQSFKRNYKRKKRLVQKKVPRRLRRMLDA